MKAITTLIIALIVSHIAIGQELNHKKIKGILNTSIEANFPNRFNSSDELKEIFYGKCSRFPKYCQKMKFDKITDLRIIQATLGEVIEEINEIEDVPPSQYDIEVIFDFTYGADNIEQYGTAIVKSVLKRVIDGYEIDHIKIIGTKSMHEYYESIESRNFYILNRLAYKNQ